MVQIWLRSGHIFYELPLVFSRSPSFFCTKFILLWVLSTSLSSFSIILFINQHGVLHSLVTDLLVDIVGCNVEAVSNFSDFVDVIVLLV
jgi:hypothetical protein